MPVQLEVTDLVRVKRTVEVEFPLYRRHDMDGEGWSTTLFTRVNEDLTWVEIEVKKDELNIETGARYQFSTSSPEYSLGLGEYACTPKSFEDALEQAQAFFAKAIQIAGATVQ